MPYTCPECDKSFEKRQGMVMHRRLVHPQPLAPPGAEDALARIDVSDLVSPEPEGTYLADGQDLAEYQDFADEPDEDAVTILADPGTGLGGVPWESNRVAAVILDHEPPPSAAATEALPVVVKPPAALPPRRRLDQVKLRCKEGYPDPMDVKWLVGIVEKADGMLSVLAQPHVLDRWNEALTQ